MSPACDIPGAQREVVGATVALRGFDIRVGRARTSITSLRSRRNNSRDKYAALIPFRGDLGGEAPVSMAFRA